MDFFKLWAFLILLLTVIISIISTMQLAKFLSKMPHFNSNSSCNETFGNVNNLSWRDTRWCIFIDVSLLSLFIIQHSFCIPVVKKIVQTLDLVAFERCAFNILSSVTIQMVMYFWLPLREPTVWNVSVFENYPLWLFFNGIQVLSWTLLFINCLVMDLSYLLGVKQVYYYVTRRPTPMMLRSPDFQHLSSKSTHSIFPFLMKLWIHPCMSLDRFVMAIMITFFMFICTDIDDNTYNYIIEQDRKKKGEFLFPSREYFL